MMLPCPAPPNWLVEWDQWTAQYDWIHAMRDCPQDAIHHAEGDVWTHVRMVCEAMTSSDEWRSLPQPAREILFSAALLHDVAKPACTREENGRITSRGHSHAGERDARRILWELGTPFEVREQICSLVRHHQAPFFLINKGDAERTAFLISQTARCDWLALLARSDALGRRCADQRDILDRVELFGEFCRERDCLDRPRQFPSARSRFEYFRKPERDPNYHAYEDARCEVIILSGLPGSGKDYWAVRYVPNLPMISLDDIRERLRISPRENQGAVRQQAREDAKRFLRAGQSFVWNATNLSHEIRQQVVDLSVNYGARVRIVYIEVSRDLLYQQNREREDAVPERALDAMMDRWDIPGPAEADSVEYWVNRRVCHLPLDAVSWYGANLA